jgi:RES domain
VKPHPEPPSSSRLLIRLFPATTTWVRIHATKREPLYFGKTPCNRFDAPVGEFGVLYVAADAHGAFIETFGHATGVRFVTMSELRVRGLAVIQSKRALRLVDLRAEGLARMGADAALTNGLDYDLARQWARAIHNHPRKPDGIVYHARHDPSRTCAAIFDRAEPDITGNRIGTFHARAHRNLLVDILNTYKFGLVP